MLICPYCKEEISQETVIKLFKCKFNFEEETLESIDELSGDLFVTVRHTKKCFPFGVLNSSEKTYKKL